MHLIFKILIISVLFIPAILAWRWKYIEEKRAALEAARSHARWQRHMDEIAERRRSRLPQSPDIEVRVIGGGSDSRGIGS